MPDIGYPSTVQVDQEGNIIPQGIDLNAGINSTPPNQDRIRWLSQVDGSVVAELYGYSTGAGPTLDNILTVKSEAATGTAQTALQALAGALLAEFDLTSVAGTSAQGMLRVDAKNFLVGDNTGRSQFVQLSAGAQDMLVCRGLVNGQGGATIVSGEGFTVSRTGTGAYTVTFAHNFPTVPAVALTTQGGFNYILGANSIAVGSFSLFSVDVGDTAQDCNFSFIAIG